MKGEKWDKGMRDKGMTGERWWNEGRRMKG